MSGNQGKVIITAAITGGIHIPTMSPYLPITPDQIVDECVRAHQAGAAVCHIHVRDPETGRPVPRMDLFRDVASRVRAQCDVVLCTTTGGAPGMSSAERLGVVTVGAGLGFGLVREGIVVDELIDNGHLLVHAPLDPRGPRCSAGHRGCVSAYLSREDVAAHASQL